MRPYIRFKRAVSPGDLMFMIVGSAAIAYTQFSPQIGDSVGKMKSVQDEDIPKAEEKKTPSFSKQDS
eukprot:GDKH01009031.1.p2 GENE.GDKH01009031.1~~GDKH01009031.1.p2  ORF type:complete len:67 (+),score=11.03 GDKH01009031.1:74-274(+)